MSRKAILLPEAKADIKDIILHYSLEGEGLKDKFLSDLTSALNLIEQFPEASPDKGRCRRKLLVKFPYSIFFSVKPESISILRVFHTSRRPGSWR